MEKGCRVQEWERRERGKSILLFLDPVPYASYILKEIADYLVIYYATSSKIIKEVEGKN